MCVCLPLVDAIDVSTTASLYKSLAQAAPEIKECVDACNFIAENTREQNDIGSVSVCVCVFISVSFFLFFFYLCFYNFSSSFSSLGDGELGVDRKDDR